jgi:tellurite resistance protein
MFTIRTLTALIIASLLGVGAVAATQASDDQGAGPGIRRFLRNHPMLRQRLIEKFDANNDGRLDQQERQNAKAAIKERLQDRRARIIQRFDTNHDGTLSPDERAAARETMQAHRAERKAMIMQKFDINKDGQLDQTERQAAREAMKARIQQHRAAGGKGA